MPYSAPVNAPGPAFDPEIVRAVAFDGFGTVFQYPVSQLRATLGRIGATLDPPVDGERLYEAWLVVGRRRWEQASPEEGPRLPRTQPFRPYRELWPQQFADAFAEVGASGDPAASNARLFDEIAQAEPYADAAPVITALRRSYRVALVSNADDVFLHPPLRASGLRFDVVLSSEAVRAYKPEPGIFEQASEALGVSPTNVLYVGDSPRADVVGAIGAGLQIAWLDREDAQLPDDVPRPHLHIRSLDELLPALGVPRD